jgi:hypothetical protein
MGRVCWQAATDGRYWIDLFVGNGSLRGVIDTGLIDRVDRIGCELEPALYDPLKQKGQLSYLEFRSSSGAHGQTQLTESGLATAWLLDPVNRQRAGPVVAVWVGRGMSGIISRVGLAFFHRLHGCQVNWLLDQRTWCIDYP